MSHVFPQPLPASADGYVTAILAGGQSQRMGQPKEGVILWDGRPMLAHVVEALRPISREIVLLGSQHPGRSPVPGLRHLPDQHPGLGPLSGLESLLASGLAERYLVVSCDQPLLTPELLLPLVSFVTDAPVFFKTTDGRPLDPFPGVFPASLLPAIRQAIVCGEYSVRRLLQHGQISWVPLPDVDLYRLTSMNTPADLDVAHRYVMSLKNPSAEPFFRTPAEVE